MLLVILFVFLPVVSTSSASLPAPSSQWRSEHNSTVKRATTCSNTTVQYSTDACPPGMFCVDGRCTCGTYPNSFISCNGSSTSVLRSFCVTFDSSQNLTVVGDCLRVLSRIQSGVDYVSDTLYHKLPVSVHQLNDAMCNSLNRTGTLCGRCLPDHYPLAYSFNMTCIKCPNVRWNWVRYIMAAYLPLTLFYIFIVFFKINTTSSHVFAVVYFCQAVSLPFNARSMLLALNNTSSGVFIVVTKIILSFYGIWNLDFFRPFYSDLCLGIGVLPTLALDYAIAVYPLLLMIISYLLIVMYERNYKIVTILWRPFRILVFLLRGKWDVKTSVMDAFATFFFLSNVKFLSVSFDLLIPTQIYQLHPNHYSYSLGLFYAGHVDYFGKEHLPYALLAITVLSCLVLLPILVLTLYPLHLRKTPFRFCIPGPTLHKLAFSFYGSYKNGTKGTHDYRWFVSVFLIARLSQFVLYFLPDKVIYVVLALMTVVAQSTMVAVLQPFKLSRAHHNMVNVLFLQLLMLFGLSLLCIDFVWFMAPQFVTFFCALAFVIGSSPIMYGLMALVYRTGAYLRGVINRIYYGRRSTSPGRESLESLPDRIAHSHDYPKENLANFTAQP